MGFTLVALLLAAPRPGPSGDEAAIHALYKAFDEGFETQAVDSIEPLFAEDYAATLADGSTNGRDETLADIREEASGAIAPIHCKEQLKRVTVEANTASVQVVEETSYQVRSPDSKLHLYRYTESYEDQLIKIDGRWQFHATHYDAEGQEQLDGKPIAHGDLKKVLSASGSEETAIRDLYARADSAFERKDLTGLAEPYASDWAVSVADEATPHDAAIARLQHEAQSALAPVRRHDEINKVTFDDDSATVLLTCETAYSVKSADGKLHTLRYTQPTEDRLARTEGRWVVQSTRLLDGGDTQLDGRTSSRDEVAKLLGR